MELKEQVISKIKYYQMIEKKEKLVKEFEEINAISDIHLLNTKVENFIQSFMITGSLEKINISGGKTLNPLFLIIILQNLYRM